MHVTVHINEGPPLASPLGKGRGRTVYNLARRAKLPSDS